MKRKLRLLHKYLSLTVAALWLMQAVTGALLVFHWELDDWAVAGPQRRLDPVRFGAFLENLQAAHSRQAVKSVYASGGPPGRFAAEHLQPKSTAGIARPACGLPFRRYWRCPRASSVPMTIRSPTTSKTRVPRRRKRPWQPSPHPPAPPWPRRSARRCISIPARHLPHWSFPARTLRGLRSACGRRTTCAGCLAPRSST